MSFTLYHTETWTRKQIEAAMPVHYAREMSRKRAKNLELLISRFQVILPIVVNRRSGLIVDGVQRALAAFDLGYANLTVSTVDLDSGGEIALCVALNNINGDWVDDFLAQQIQVIAAQEPHLLSITGFSDTDLFRLTTPRAEPKSSQPEPSLLAAKTDLVQAELFIVDPIDESIEDNESVSVEFESTALKSLGGAASIQYRRFVSEDAEFVCREEYYLELLQRLGGDTIKQKSDSFAKMIGLV